MNDLPSENSDADLQTLLPQSVLAFRGYNVTNLGRSHEMLAHRVFGPTVKKDLQEATDICAEISGKKVDLIGRVERQQETSLETYHEAIALIMAMEMTQLRLLKEFFDIDYHGAPLSLGYSLGEISALVAGGTLSLAEALKIPLSLADDCIKLAQDVTLGVLFSRGHELSFDEVQQLCLEINSEGRGVLGVSSFLSPNTVLIMGQQDTLDRFRSRMNEALHEKLHLRKNANVWPPLHTPIVWQHSIPNRAAVAMHTLQGGFTKPSPDILSLVTGKTSYNEFNTRELIHQWVDHPQRLWDVVYETLTRGIETIIHIGPQPNLIPATYHRLADNVESLTNGSVGMRALSAIVSRPWLQALLPSKTALLRAPFLKHIILEDWLLEQKIE